MRITPSLRVCRVLGNTWLHGCRLRLGMIVSGTKVQAVCNRWEEPRRSSIRVACLHHAIHARAMAYSLLLAYRHFSSLLSSVFLLPQNWFKKDLTIESLSW